MKPAIALLATLLSATASAEEGMWTLNNFPSQKVKAAYGFEPTAQWLDQVRLASARLAGGCSASFVSGQGLVMTNHHCVSRCVEELSSAKRDLMAQGFFAKRPQDELQCPRVEVNQLLEIADVTQRVRKATEGLKGREYNDAQKAEQSRIEKECAVGDEVRCDVVSLYHGGQFHLYKYKRYQDARLVFAPEFAIAFFGGDPDNFTFPRYDLDVAFLRVYEGGKPAPTPHHFRWSEQPVKENDLVFTSGHPGATSRLATEAELAFQRDVALPSRLFSLSELRGLVTEFQHRGPEQRRIAGTLLFGVENRLKALKGRHLALLDPALMEKKRGEEAALRKAVASDPAKQAAYGDAWAEIVKALGELRAIYKPLTFIEQGSGFHSELYSHARNLVRLSDELTKPNDKRLREYADSKLPALRQALLGKAPIYPELEIATLTHSLTKLREELSADHPVVKKVLGKRSPQEVATSAVRGSKLGDPAARKALLDGGKAAVEKSTDAMIVLARLVDEDARPVRQKFEDEIDSVLKAGREKIARARFAVQGTSTYPDATFSLRLTYGQVKGFPTDLGPVPAVTTLAGAFERHTGRHPYALPKTWLAHQKDLDRSTPFNFSSTCDIIGGNSGSPMINDKAEIVGLVFDGNLDSLGGEYVYEPSRNRAVGVHSAAIRHTLERIYGAERLARELGAPAQPGPVSGGR